MLSSIKYDYRRKAPHLQKNNRPIFLTFCTYRRLIIPETLRSMVLDCCLRPNTNMYELHTAVVMPDHLHLLLTPRRDDTGWPYSIPDIARAIKGPSAKWLNRALGRQGRVWQEECFDHVLRSDESFTEKIEYILNNPVRAGLVRKRGQYPWVWDGDAPYLAAREK
jgi:putative transposase